MSRFVSRGHHQASREDFDTPQESWLDDVSGLCGADLMGHVLCQRTKEHDGPCDPRRAEMICIDAIRLAEMQGWTGEYFSLSSEGWRRVYWRRTGFTDAEREQLAKDAIAVAVWLKAQSLLDASR